MDVRTVVGLAVGLVVGVALFAVAARLQRSAHRRVIAALDAFVASTNAATPYRSANAVELQRPSRESGPEGPRLRFAYLGQRALLDFAWPRTTAGEALASRTFGDFELGPGASTLLRFWITPARSAVFTGGEGAESFAPDARPHLDALAGLVPKVRLATREDGLFVVADGVLGISLDREKLAPFVEHACALVRLHLDDRLFASS
jgi:hypothetical protein